MDLVWQLENSLQGLPQQQSRVARFVLENLQFSCSATLEQLAQQAGVSADTLSAFARSVGCRDIDDFVQQLRALQHHSPETHRVQPAIAGDVDYAGTASLEKLAASAGVSADTVKRFARSIGREDFDDILFQIGKRLNELSQQEARVARAVLANVSFAASATIDQLASHAGVSPATITRFAKSVGCEDIRELRMKLAQASASHSRYMAPGAAPLSAGERRLAEVQQVLQQQLQQTPPSNYAEAAQLLRQARNVTIFTAGGSETIYGLQVQQQLMAQGVTSTLSQEAHLIGINAAMLSADQALLIISLSESDASLRNAALLARSRNVPLVVLACATHPLAALADILLALPEDPLLARYGLLMTLDLLSAPAASAR
ncbi:SIS domain-containing protein [Mixta tenebrionis]|uniref:SIS domain-containing protein n=1 Tax=Mixta tenebrionis TaxID=2562439 RepID=A0A506VDB5_9GAMM|nr:MurR/RpiR family transcriptional regulator [Mixta tenebrionis]TPW43625.1 SIS domain-containing protein [Mixta tenebrionis]